MADNKKRTFWYITCNDILSILCAAAVPIALGIYTAITYQQEQQQAMQNQQFTIKQAIESRQDALYDQFLHNVYNLDKDGYLNESEKPWAFANAYYRAAHRQLDPVRKGDVLQFLKEKQLIGRNNCSTGCNTKELDDIIRLNELNFDDVHLKSETGLLNRLNLECVVFDQVSMNNAIFSYANLNGVSFDQGRLDNANFGNSSLRCASFNGTDLRGVDFGNSDLKDAHFENVDLSTAKLTEDQLKQASFTNTTLPNGKTTEKRPRLPTTIKSTTTTTITTSLSTKSSTLTTTTATTTTKTTSTTTSSSITVTTTIRSSTMTTATTTVENIITTPMTTTVKLPAQCSSYMLITDETRNIAWTSTAYTCDDALFTATPTWVRFSGAAGTQLATKVVKVNSCNTNFPGYYTGSMPSSIGDTTKGDVCYNEGENTCLFRQTISVTNCNSFYVYALAATGICQLRYCTE